MQASQAAFDIIQEFEGWRLTPYLDTAGLPTVGWGHRLLGMSAATISQAYANALLAQDVAYVAATLTRELGATQLRQCQFDALVSLGYNVGANIQAVAPHLWVGVMSHAAPINVANCFLDIVHDAKGVVQPGLVRRRQAEVRLFLSA